MADSKWGGIAVAADEIVLHMAMEVGWAIDGERYRKAVKEVEAELRRRVEPLLEAAQILVEEYSSVVGETFPCETNLRKELDTWRSK